MTKLINRNLFFDNPAISGGVISHDGAYVSFMKEYEGIMNLWIKRFDEDFENAIPLTKSKSPILGHFWSFDSRHILYVNDKDGDENINIFKIEVGQDISAFPDSTNLTPLKEVTAQVFLVSEKNPEILMVGINDRDKAWHDLYELNIKSGELSLKQENTDRLGGWEFDWDEKPRIAYRTDKNGHNEILRINDDQSTTKIFETNLKESASIIRWLPDNSKCYLITNKGDIDLSSMFLMDLETLELTFVENDPEGKSDIGNAFFDRNSRELIFTAYTYHKTKRYWKNQEWATDFKILEQELGDKEYEITSKTKDNNKFLINVSSDVHVLEVYCFDRKSKKLNYQYTTRPSLKELESHLSPMKPITYKSSDGLAIPGYFTTPKQVPQPYPLVVLVHGGPKGPRDYWGYNGAVQFLANRGYAVLQPNFRASGGFGKSYLNAGDKEWGKKMQDDITYGVKYLINEGLVEESRVAIMGGSYGGYATLAGLAFTPDVYACGIDIVGPSNLFTLLESIPPYWEAGRKWLYEMVGDPETEEGQKLLKEASPLFSADKIEKPLLIVQGANDPRVKKAESDQIVEALSNSKIPVDYLCAFDEGHGFRKPINSLAMYAEIEKFLAIHIGGRYQESIEKEVADNLEKLRQ